MIQRLSDSAAVPDTRSGSPSEPKHFMDMDALPEFATRSITHDRDSLFMTYGEPYVRNTLGFLPWVIDSTLTALTNQFSTKDWNRAWSTAADLGHYIADAHQPLHATQHYNGNTSLYGSGSSGIHSRYETTMISTYQTSLIIDSSNVHYIPNPLDTVFAIMYESCSYTDSILITDYTARQTTGSSSSSAYYAALWQHLGSMTLRQFRKASVEYGSFLYTAWINAGSPTIVDDRVIARIEGFRLNQNYPNPFNPTTSIPYSLPVKSTVVLTVRNLLGQTVAELVHEVQGAGAWQAMWHADVSSGIYFYSIEAVSTENPQQGFFETRKMILLK